MRGGLELELKLERIICSLLLLLLLRLGRLIITRGIRDRTRRRELLLRSMVAPMRELELRLGLGLELERILRPLLVRLARLIMLMLRGVHGGATQWRGLRIASLDRRPLAVAHIVLRELPRHRRHRLVYDRP